MRKRNWEVNFPPAQVELAIDQRSKDGNSTVCHELGCHRVCAKPGEAIASHHEVCEQSVCSARIRIVVGNRYAIGELTICGCAKKPFLRDRELICESGFG